MYLGRLNTYSQSAVSSDGSATVTFTADQDWLIDLTSVALDVTVSTAVVKMYLGPVTTVNLVGQSQVGYGDANDTRFLVLAGETLNLAWSSATGANTAMSRLLGTRYQPGSGYLYWTGNR